MNKTNGHAPQQQQINVKFFTIARPNGAKLVYVTDAGDYLGTIEFDIMGPHLMPLLAQFFSQFAAQQAGNVQVVSPGALPPGMLKS
jgi:hypothetical protein